jgi:predicted enzyme related to lactoylglutathione lyase
MGERTSYPPGTFSWAELVTSDAAAAKAFYTDVFGWDYRDNPVGEGMVYSTALLGGQAVAALYTSDQPPHWNSYVTVASADETAAKAGELGATVMAEPFDVLDVGRMAVIADPTGAALCLWEPRAHIGASLVNAPGALAWNDLVTSDPQTAARFYGGLFGWTFMEIPDAGYSVIQNDGRSNGGMLSREGMPPAWMPNFGHADLDGLPARVGELGGRVLSEPMNVPNGRFAVFADPQGAVFCALTGDYDD